MNPDLLTTDLPQALLDLKKEIEDYCDFKIALEHDPFLAERGKLVSGPTSMTLKVRWLPVDPAVVAHELCHARRYYNRKTWMMEFVPPRYFGTGEERRSAAENLDNMLEHLVILQEMDEELGFPKNDSHVFNDLNAMEMKVVDPFLRKSTMMTNWLLSNYHFPNHIQRVRQLLEEDGLLPVAETLLSKARAANGSKAKMISALVKALEVPQSEVRLRRRDPKSGGQDEGAMLSEVLETEAGSSASVG